MRPQVASVVIVGRNERLARVAERAARTAFPGTQVGFLPEFDAGSMATPPPGTELLVLLEPEALWLESMIAAVDSRNGPRWALIVCSPLPIESDSQAVCIPSADWSEPTLALAFGTALKLHALVSANARLRGDLQAIGRRLGHDVRGPLNCIQTSTEALRDLRENAAASHQILDRSIAQSIDEIMALLGRISLVVNATTQPVSLQSVIMEEVVWGALQRLESHILAGNVTLSKPQKWPIVVGVPLWLEVIWANLLANSLKHGRPQPHITLGWDEVPGEYRFWIQNDGPRVSDKVESRLFHPFDRLSDLDAPKGFGLPVVHRLVELQGGRCGHETEPAGSGIFFFSLPATADRQILEVAPERRPLD